MRTDTRRTLLRLRTVGCALAWLALGSTAPADAQTDQPSTRDLARIN